MHWHISRSNALAALAASPQPFAELLRHGTMSVEIFRPHGRDMQQPHAQDELYFIIRGAAVFEKAGERVAVGPGDTLFVEADVAHRFHDFSDDFETFVVFWGPPGGEP
jgi:mannose-6-phosphate isomerase-like protein (cupin superfamily)